VIDPGPLQTVSEPQAVVRLGGFVAGALVVSGTVAAGYRGYSRRRVPFGVAALVGMAVVAVYLQTAGLYGDVLTGTDPAVFRPATATFNLLALGAGLTGGLAGWRVGDRVATDVFALAGVRELEGGVGRAATALGRVTALELPAEVEDVEGYDPVSAGTKADLAGKTLLFPRRLGPAEARDRLVARLREDYDVGAVDVEVEDGAVTYLAVGSRPAGIGQTLAPGVVAVAVRGDPPTGASPGDVVQLWQPGPEASRVATAELRGVDGDVVTVALDEADAGALSPETAYRVVTVPAAPRAERELAAAVRAADETLGTVAVAAGSGLDGVRIGDLDVAVVAVRSAGETTDAVPPRDRRLAPGDTCYVVARPDTLRRLEARGRAQAGETSREADGGSGDWRA
jgi:hypothetical protein